MSRTVSLKNQSMDATDESAQTPPSENKEVTDNDKKDESGGTENAMKTDEPPEGITQAVDNLSVQSNAPPADKSSDGKDEADHFLSDLQDAWPFGQTKPFTERPDADMPVDSKSPEYNMKHKTRGFAVIIAYSEFALGGPGPRRCAKHDAKICKEAFEKLHYDVKIYENLVKSQFLELLKIVRDADHSSRDSLVIVFMSHGGVHEKTNQEFLWTYDAEVNTSELWKNLTPEKCPSLAGKPKLFFIQACRGEEVDKGVQLKKPKSLSVHTDGISITKASSEDYAIPLYADMLMMWASYPGMFAFKSRNNGMKGSVFLHFLAKVLKEDAHNEDLMSMLIRITREVAIHYESYVPGDDTLHQNKQIPQIVSTLMRKLRFL